MKYKIVRLGTRENVDMYVIKRRRWLFFWDHQTEWVPIGYHGDARELKKCVYYSKAGAEKAVHDWHNSELKNKKIERLEKDLLKSKVVKTMKLEN